MKEIVYADSSSWEEWKREYRYGAFYIFPPTGVIESVDNLRSMYDPTSASYCQAHINLSEPLVHPLSESDLRELREALSTCMPFEIHFGPLRSFLPHPGIAYAISPEDKFRELRSANHSTSPFKNSPRKREHIAPHMTIAEFIDVEETEKLMRELSGKIPEGSFLCDAIEYAVPTKEFYFERILTLTMG
jgi:2'-5' RNA ligase